MGVIINNRKYTDNFQGSNNNWLLGNVGDWQELELDVDLSCKYEVTQQHSVAEINQGYTLKLNDGTNWADYGFAAGDSVHIVFTENNSGTIIKYVEVHSITLIQGDELTSSTKWLDFGGVTHSHYPYNNGTLNIYDLVLYVDHKPQGIKTTYGLLDNADASTANLSSFIDGNLSQFQALNTDTLTGLQSFTNLGLQSGMSIYSTKWQFISANSETFDNDGTPVTLVTSYSYKIFIVFMIDGFFDDLTNFDIPYTAPSVNFNANSLTDNFKIIGYPIYNNPNLKIQSDPSKSVTLGNTGWFNQNFNGLPNVMSIADVVYTDVGSSTTTSQLSFTQNTKIDFTVKGIGNLSSSTEIQVGFIWLPEDETFYQNKQTGFHKNLLINTCQAPAAPVTIFNPGGATQVVTIVFLLMVLLIWLSKTLPSL